MSIIRHTQLTALGDAIVTRRTYDPDTGRLMREDIEITGPPELIGAPRGGGGGHGPHDASSVNERGERNCGCRHDGLRWLSMCTAARVAWQLTHNAAALEHAARIATTGDLQA